VLAIAACVSLIGATAAGCATPATSAAQVGDTAISESVIFDRTTSVVEQVQAQGDPAPDAATLAELNRRQTTSAIRSKLLEVAANDVGVTVTDEQVNAALADDTAATAASQLGAPQTMVDQTVRDLLRLEGLVATQPAAGAPITNVIVSVDGVSVPTRDEAVATRSKFLADPAAVDGLVAASASPVNQTFTILQTPTVAPTGVFAAEQGDVLLYPGPDGYFVIRIKSRSVEPAVLTAADLTPQELGGKFDLGALLLGPYAEAAGITVNPRLGVWDPLTLQVIPGGSGL
jgi:hypothetical protein